MVITDSLANGNKLTRAENLSLDQKVVSIENAISNSFLYLTYRCSTTNLSFLEFTLN